MKASLSFLVGIVGIAVIQSGFSQPAIIPPGGTANAPRSASALSGPIRSSLSELESQLRQALGVLASSAKTSNLNANSARSGTASNFVVNEDPDGSGSNLSERVSTNFSGRASENLSGNLSSPAGLPAANSPALIPPPANRTPSLAPAPQTNRAEPGAKPDAAALAAIERQMRVLLSQLEALDLSSSPEVTRADTLNGASPETERPAGLINATGIRPNPPTLLRIR